MGIQSIKRDSSVPIKEQLRQWILGQVTSGALKTSDRIPSINKLAQTFQISRETVRQGLESLVQRGVLVPVHGRGYFIGQRSTRKVRIALLGKIDGVYMRPIYEGLTQEIGPSASILVVDPLHSGASLRGLLENLAYHHAVDRLLVIPVRGQENSVNKLLTPFRRSFKVGWLDRAPTETKDAAFLCDYRRCVSLAMERFASSGISQRMYYSRNKEDRSVFSTMRKSFKEYEKLHNGKGRVIDKWEAIQKRALRQKGQPLGVLTETNAEAIHLQTRLLNAGVRIPEQVSIITIDNTEWTEQVSPRLTAVDPRFDELGIQAARWIQAEEPDATPAIPIQFISKPQLIERDSCLPQP